MNVWLTALVTWGLFVPIAILNGIVRNSVYQQYVGELAAHQISTVIGSLAFMGLAYLLLKNKIGKLDKGQLWLMGLIWVLMTIGFEFGFGHYIVGHSWEKLFFDYNIFVGRVWSLFLISCGLTPLILKKLIRK